MNNFPSNWLPAPKKLVLLSDDVHIWKINLQQSESQIQSFRETLSSDEVARAERFYFPEHRQRFIVGRGSLRTILGSYLGVEPSQLEFDYQQRGKPILAAKFADSGIFFNLSHSQDLGLCGVSYQRLIGVDLEFIRPMSDLENLARRFFLPQEYAVIKLLTPEQKQQVFFRYWTCKEAYLKATGDGLIQLEQIGIELTPTEPAQLKVSGNWQLKELLPADNFVAAVVVDNHSNNFQFWQL
ncbi:4'-phosphopantetheinyl transferase superfamily protein [Sphaerospermopsis sp. FACHB-1094]|uniref:4'-phosphopantetheinyl transferase n=1 Tax=Sphaerospermopsis reniformis TaxID=531300 RepID=A0A480A662_9CYAN|nr:4'-phosphopantetheinyl transferase HetI [Sphaerospermopsis reniformis]MBD2133000.1 4'-phosphopantetheinyl transferase superfamily protein [Sphaerospermopsis sp. FACHB-1094]GCL38818.1 4'-phosphopantetheinyl transferase [Sphaerospermopsis reniformis]